MPNWVRNEVTFDNKQVLKDLINENEDFDFNKIVPMPVEYEKDDWREGKTVEEQLLFLKENAGMDDWYGWCNHFWGTKWNADSTCVHDEHTVTFNTAWAMPDPIFKAISEKYKTRIVAKFADEGDPCNSGTVIYEDGIDIDYVMGDEKFKNELWGWGNGEEDDD